MKPMSKFFQLIASLVAVFCMSLPLSGWAQRLVAGDTLYGHEWIRSESTYLKIAVTDEGIYRVTGTELAAAGFSNVTGARLEIVHFGQPVAPFVSTEAAFGPTDYFEFVHDSRVSIAYEAELFPGRSTKEMLSPHRRIFTDTVIYYLRTDADVRGPHIQLAPLIPKEAERGSPTIIRESVVSGVAVFGKVAVGKDGDKFSSFRPGEGWSHGEVQRSEVTLPLPGRLATSNVFLEVRTLANYTTNGHLRTITVDGLELQREAVENNVFRIDSFEIAAGKVASSGINVVLNGEIGPTDRNHLGDVLARYQAVAGFGESRNFMAEVSAELEASGSITLYAQGNSGRFRVIHPKTGRLWEGDLVDSITFQTTGLNAGDQLYFVLNDAKSAARLATFKPLNIDPRNAEYIAIGSRKQADWAMGAKEYAAFRQNPRHGGYRTAAYLIEDLYDQYNYGLTNDARAIRNVTNHGVLGVTKLVLLLGKGREFNVVRTAEQIALPGTQSNFVPTFGIPSSDNLTVLNGLTGRMNVGVGRLPVESATELDIMYRKAVAVDEVLSDNPQLRGLEWTKHVFHVGGGSNPSEQASIRNGLQGMANIAEQGELAAEVTGIYKRDNSPILSTDLDQLFNRVNTGVNLMVFYGHGSSQTLEINFKRPERYNNKDRYPLLLAYGCYSGNCNVSQTTIGEEFVTFEDKGFVGFGASTGPNYIFSINVFAYDFNRAFSETHYDEPVGIAFREAVNKSLARGTQNPTQYQHGEQFLFQGDPALMMYKHRGPDVIFDETSFEVSPNSLTPELDSFDLKIDLVNLGKGTKDTFYVVVDRASPARARSTVDTIPVFGIQSPKTISLTLPSWGKDGVGLNQVWLRIEGLEAQSIVAGALSNDASGPFGFVVESSTVQIIYPTKFEVVDTLRPALYAEAGNFWNEAKTFEWQICDEPSYSSPALQTETILSRSLVSWIPPQSLERNTQYYFRVRADGDSVWAERQFRTGDVAVVADLQSFPEFNSGKSEFLSPITDEKWKFGNTGLNYTFVYKADQPYSPPSFKISFENQAISIQPWTYSDTTVTMLLVDSLSGQAFPFNGAYGSRTAGNPNRTLTFSVNTPQQRAKFANLLDSLPQRGNFVYFWLNFKQGTNFEPDSWVGDSLITGGRSILGILRENGAQRIDDWIARGTAPYVYVYQKGFGPIAEMLGDDSTSILTASIDIPVRRKAGSYRTPYLGPLKSARAISWKFADDQIQSSDLAALDLRGITQDGDTISLFRSSSWKEVYTLTPGDTSRFKYIFLQVELTDEVNRSPPALLQFVVNGSLRPELAFDPNTLREFPQDSIAPKQTVPFAIALRNVSPTPMDANSLLSVERLPSNALLVSDTIPALRGWQSYIWRDTLEVREAGLQQLAWRISALDITDQRQVANDLGYNSFVQGSDQTKPDVQVTVDGEPLRQNQLLAPSPVFRIDMRDDIALDSMRTDQLRLEMTSPSGERYVAGTLPGEVRLLPSSGRAARERVWEYAPGRLSNGIYTLQVSSVDDSGNRSANSSLRYSFEIDTSTAVSNVLPYPNPMVDAVRFQYELTGEIPSDYQIQIYTTSGRLVRSLGPSDLGPLQIGRRMTQGIWNGTDEYGQRLARGVYLYRFEVTKNLAGEDFKNRATGGMSGPAIKSGFGKLVVVR